MTSPVSIGTLASWPLYAAQMGSRMATAKHSDSNPAKYAIVGITNAPSICSRRTAYPRAPVKVIDRRAIGRQHVGPVVDVLEGDGAGANRGEQLVALPVDAGVADGAARV